jgi:hypothetical protein
VTLQAIRQVPVGEALSPPLVHEDDEAALLQVAHHLEVLLYGLGPACRQDDRAARPALRAKEGGAKARPALAVERDHYLTGTMRRTLKAMNRDRQDAPDVKPDFEFNPRHPLVARLEQIRHQDPDLAAKAAAQMYDNARMAAGLLEDPRPMLQRLNELLAQVLTPKA